MLNLPKDTDLLNKFIETLLSIKSLNQDPTIEAIIRDTLDEIQPGTSRIVLLPEGPHRAKLQQCVRGRWKHVKFLKEKDMRILQKKGLPVHYLSD